MRLSNGKKIIHVFSAVTLLLTMIYPGKVESQVTGSESIEDLIAAEPPAIATAKRGMDELISLDLRSIDIADALKYLALKAGLNIVVNKTAAGRVTLVVRDVPLKDAFDILLISNELAYEKRGEIYYIMTDADYQKLFGRSFSDNRIVKTFRLKYAIPEQAFNFIDALKSDIGRVVVDQENGTVVVMDTKESIEEIEKVIGALECKGSVKVFDLQYAKARDVEEHLKTRLDAKNVGTVKADERSNQVIVYTLPEKMGEIEEIIKALDKRTKQVFINAQIVKIALTDDYDSGVDWEVVFRQLNEILEEEIPKLIGDKAAFGLGMALPIDSLLTNYGTFTLGSVTDQGYDITMNFLKTLGQTKILSNPRLSVMNNQEARIHVGRREVYVTTTTTTGQTTTTQAEEATFLDVGIQLAVTPVINDDGYITMKIKPEISSVVDEYETPSGNVIPIVDTSTAETTVVVKDGSTIIIGGLRREDKQTTHKGVPYLQDIPILGEIFKSRNDDLESTELLIMITPTISSGDNIITGDKHMDSGSMGFMPYKEYDKFNPDGDNKEGPKVNWEVNER